MPDGAIRHIFSPGVAGMVSWRMPDGTEIVCVGIPVEADKLREFVVRFMGAAGAGWHSRRWSETLFGSAFQELFGERGGLHHEDRPDGRRVVASRRPATDERGPQAA